MSATPPKRYDVIDRHGGFTAEYEPPFHANAAPHDIGVTLWVSPPHCEFGAFYGDLIEGSVNENTFYQNHTNVISAKYRLPGRRQPAVVWWDKETGRRYA